MAQSLLCRIYLNRRHPGRIHNVNPETGLTWCGLDPGPEQFLGDPKGGACDRCWSEIELARRPHRGAEIAGQEVIERPLLWTPTMVAYQVDLFVRETYRPPVQRPRIVKPKCPVCEDMGLEPDRLPAAGGGWRCGRGHGLLGGPQG